MQLEEESNDSDNERQDGFEFQSDAEVESETVYVLQHEEIRIEQTVDMSAEGFHVVSDEVESEMISMEETVIDTHQQRDSDSYGLYDEQQPRGHSLIDVKPELTSLVLKHVENVIEEVIQAHAATVTDEELVQYQSRLRLEAENSRFKRRRIESPDPMALPFQYAGQSFNVQSQKLLLNTIHFLKMHHKDFYLESIKNPQERAAKVLNISPSVIAKIRKNWKEGKGKLEQAAQRRVMKKRILDGISDSDEMTIRSIIKEINATG